MKTKSLTAFSSASYIAATEVVLIKGALGSATPGLVEILPELASHRFRPTEASARADAD